MAVYGKKGDLADIKIVALQAGGRAPQVPSDTRNMDLEMKVKGFLCADSAVGEMAEIETFAGRRMSGTLTQINPEYSHKFGAPIPELVAVGRELRMMLHAIQSKKGAE